LGGQKWGAGEGEERRKEQCVEANLVHDVTEQWQAHENGIEALGCTDNNKFIGHMSDCLPLKSDCCI
jgi:hypothetical protein